MPTALFRHLKIVSFIVSQSDLVGVRARSMAAVMMDRRPRQRTDSAQTVCGVYSLLKCPCHCCTLCFILPSPYTHTHTHTLTDPRAANPPSDSPVHWEFIVAGTCGTVLLLAVAVLVGIATYAYRHKQKQRQRRCVL